MCGDIAVIEDGEGGARHAEVGEVSCCSGETGVLLSKKGFEGREVRHAEWSTRL